MSIVRWCVRVRPLAGGALALSLALALASASPARAQAPPAPAPADAAAADGRPTLTIRRAAGAIEVDGKLGDPGWEGAARVDTWFETNPGDNTPPKVPHVGWLAYDDRFFYAAFEFADPEPGRIRAPYAERDNVPSTTDYGGVIIDTRNDRKTAQMFLANPRGIQYDALTGDAVGEDSSPDFFWESAGSITDKGWILELRIPFSSLRYDGDAQPQTWGILLYRNWPRDFRHQMFSATLPRGGNCFICRRNDLVGLEGLPRGGHVIAAPFLAASQEARPEAGLGSRLEDGDAEAELGLDVKWIPDPDLVLDATLNPDFSQVESDAAQIAANERFALFFPEKRPFFLEAIDLFSTPFRVVHTRSITAPRWGARATGKRGDTAYTALVADDRGGGLVIIPGEQESAFAEQDFESLVGVARVRHDLGDSFVSFLATTREIDGGGSNRVFGPDFRWQPNASDTVTGQVLWSRSETPERPDLAAEWNGQSLAGHAADLWWAHSTTKVDWFIDYTDVGEEYRADNGFRPQVGFRHLFSEAGYTFRPTGFLRRVRTFLVADYTENRDGDLLFRQLSPGVGIDGKWNSFVRLRYAFDEVASGAQTFERDQLIFHVEASPSRRVSYVALFGNVGEEVDFENSRPGDGGTVSLRLTLNATDHLELRWNADRRWIDVRGEDGRRGRLFTADVGRLRGTYTFTARAYLRLIGQWVETENDPGLYTFPVEERSGGFAGSALFAYKLNWQTVLFLGYGDNRALLEGDRLEPADRQAFLKVSYAFQR
ncbi:MAG TPA: DUF5916 domain-containing protein [Thermoanaerobaculia bacterium]|nr:DUF5916 domain-containing protein [Thermoanaerobaculia bacterium]